MARMIPDSCPPDTASFAERLLFDSFKVNLDNNYTIIHSFPWIDDGDHHLEEGECDFLVLHPDKGLLAIEAKTNVAKYEGPLKKWLDIKGESLRKDPFIQARKSAHFLNNKLTKKFKQWKELKPCFGHAVAFPDRDTIELKHPPSHVIREIMILSDDLNNLQSKIDSILLINRPYSNKIDRSTFENIINFLLPIFKLSQTFSSMISINEPNFIRLTKQQYEILNAMRNNNKLIIQGCVGSGKTMLIIEKATSMSENDNILICCFNEPLSRWLRSIFRESVNIDVYHFHGLCKHIIEKVLGAGSFIRPDKNKEDFYFSEAPLLLLESLDRYSKRYNAILIDEGQDFYKDWWDPLLKLLADNNSLFYIFFDPQQNIYKREIIFPFKTPPIILDKNCRNTVNVAKFVHNYGNITASIADFAPEGIEPNVIEVNDDKGELDNIQSLFHKLIYEQKIKANQLIILGRNKFENSIFSSKKKLGNFTVVNDIFRDSPNLIRYTTIYKFKGLESECVIISKMTQKEFNSPNEEDRKLFSEAFSRAKHFLYIFTRP